MGRFKGRSAVACHACHRQKLKCDGGNPCRRCGQRSRECTYPERESITTVSERYLRWLEDRVSQADSASDGAGLADARPSTLPQARLQSETQSGPSVSQEDCSTDGFIQKLSLILGQSDMQDYVARSQPGVSAGDDSADCTYFRLRIDSFQTRLSFKLPPRSWAFKLLDAFEEAFCDYHWYLRKAFRERLALTYSDPSSQSTDRGWLCRVSVVLALGETFHKGRPANMGSAEPMPAQNSDSSSALPGTNYFEQALLLLKPINEEPSLEDVECLNLLAFYCYSLNRTKSAFFYATQSIGLIRLLQLHRPSATPHNTSSSNCSASVAEEHQRRIWWTSYCMDRMITTELGIEPLQSRVPEGLVLPSSMHLTPEEADEFFDGDILAAQAQLCEMKRTIVIETVPKLCSVRKENIGDVLLPCLHMLQAWPESLSSQIRFRFTPGVPSTIMAHPAARVLVSLYLRYHQCFILLLRPLHLQQLVLIKQSKVLGQAVFGDMDSHLRGLSSTLFRAAYNNCRLLVDLWTSSKIARFGYWDSTHLFSCLLVLDLTDTVIREAEREMAPDPSLYAQARRLLDDMAILGNPSAKNYQKLLRKINNITQMLTSGNDLGLADQPLTDFNWWDESEGELGQLIAGGLSDQWYDIDWENLLIPTELSQDTLYTA